MSAVPFDATTDAQPWPLPDKNVHPVFAGILQAVEAQPAMLARAAAKAEPRRFAAVPAQPSAFGALPDQQYAPFTGELRPETREALRILGDMKLAARHCDLQALIATASNMADEIDTAAPGLGYDDIVCRLDEAHDAMDHCGGPTEQQEADERGVQRSRELQATRGQL